MASGPDPTKKRSLVLLAALAAVFAGAILFHHFRQPAAAPVPPAALQMCWEKHNINSREYWDCRFVSQHWQSRHGDQQSEYFYGLLVEMLPEPVKAEMRARRYSVVDFGCAQGEGTERFAEAFPDSPVTGVDISPEAIKIAHAKRKRVDFVATDLTTHPGSWDVLITSNTLEHFHEPWDMARRLQPKVGRYFIILVPFNEVIVKPSEHFYSFTWDNIPQALDEFRLIHTGVTETDPRWWNGTQVMLIYARDQKAPDRAGHAARADRK